MKCLSISWNSRFSTSTCTFCNSNWARSNESQDFTALFKNLRNFRGNLEIESRIDHFFHPRSRCLFESFFRAVGCETIKKETRSLTPAPSDALFAISNCLQVLTTTFAFVSFICRMINPKFRLTQNLLIRHVGKRIGMSRTVCCRLDSFLRR